MDDTRRTKILGAALLGVLLIYFGRSAVDGWLFGPVRTLERGLSTSQGQAEVLADRLLELRMAENKLAEWTDHSLPSNIDDAQRLYREWLVEICRYAGFSGPGFEVTPSSRSDQKEYNVVSVEIRKAETDLEGLSRFLYVFDQAALMHRVSSLNIDSSGARGNSRLTVNLTAEGLSVEGTENRAEIFPRGWVSEDFKADADELKVSLPESFPIAADSDEFEPFLIRIGLEFFRVTAVKDGMLTVDRAQMNSEASEHPSGSIAELFPVMWERRNTTLEDYKSILANSPFVIPSPPKTFTPRLSGLSDRKIQPGDDVKLTARAEETDSALGKATFELVRGAAGASIDPETGVLVWETADTTAPGEYEFQVRFFQENAKDVFITDEFSIDVEVPNEPPAISLDKSAVVILGQEFQLQARGTDDGGAEKLKFSLGGGAPEGLQVDSASGLISWTPPRTFAPGDYQVTVNVTDGGSKPKSASAQLTLLVQDDFSRLTLLAATVSRDGKWFAWLRNKGTGRTEKLAQGSEFQVSAVSGRIEKIDARQMVFQNELGTWALQLGRTLDLSKLIRPPAAETDRSSDQEGATAVSTVTQESTEEFDGSESATTTLPAESSDSPTEPNPESEPAPESEPTSASEPGGGAGD